MAKAAKQKVVKSETETTTFGNMDTEKKHDLSALKIPDNHYVVRHFNTVQLPSGVVMEDPGSSRFQVYDPETFQKMNAQTVKDGKQLPSQFQALGLNVDVLHEPE